MITGAQVLEMLIPNGGWVITGNEFEGIQFLDCDPISKKEFQDGFAKYEAYAVAKESAVKAQKDAILERLGITAEEAVLLLS